MSYISVIIPVYNCGQFLRRCLDSLVNQSFKDWEAICINDGSKDNSGEILDEYAAKDNRFKVVHKVNEGVSEARNTAAPASCWGVTNCNDGCFSDSSSRAAASMSIPCFSANA